MEYIDISCINEATYNHKVYNLRLLPIKYLDNRTPRLPRKSSKGYKLINDTYFYFSESFKNINTAPTKNNRFKVCINIQCGKDRLGTADLDNYCKILLDAITFTQKVWIDDKYVDEISIKRTYNDEKFSQIILQIEEL